MKKLEGKIALITGGTSGIGRATADLSRQESAQVIVTGRSASGPDSIKCDVTKLRDISAMASEVRTRCGRVDVLFVNAGVCHFRPISEVDEAFFDEHFDTNVKGAYFTVQQILPLIPDGGAILLNASVAARIARPRISVYAATKPAVLDFREANRSSTNFSASTRKVIPPELQSSPRLALANNSSRFLFACFRVVSSRKPRLKLCRFRPDGVGKNSRSLQNGRGTSLRSSIRGCWFFMRHSKANLEPFGPPMVRGRSS